MEQERAGDADRTVDPQAGLEIVTTSPAGTAALGQALAEGLVPGDLVALVGVLGAGKTVFAAGVARGLGVRESVVSPTFTIVREYEGVVPLQHIDLYRLSTLTDALDLGLDEVLDRDAVTLVEWGDLLPALLPLDRLEVRLAPRVGRADERIVTVTGCGPVSRTRVDRLGRRAPHMAQGG